MTINRGFRPGHVLVDLLGKSVGCLLSTIIGLLVLLAVILLIAGQILGS